MKFTSLFISVLIFSLFEILVAFDAIRLDVNDRVHKQLTSGQDFGGALENLVRQKRDLNPGKVLSGLVASVFKGLFGKFVGFFVNRKVQRKVFGDF